ncbi:hypothetical protein HWB51_gp077 [Mycobacterium phage Cuke]|uniref:Uncharacterized protein n=1 Tax=Mycobacterium phage Cuke TaxID=2079417 RepID=A0A2L1IX50_9CAUD|nr:hypothetical protein HWB51_gp077 [Mycobacterium phage Cuke]AVD99735.1 hypothetical protein SEA_CUKE_119 [Mycobacterium phage Cuke]
MSALPFVPWWHHPNHRYVGKHRGTYQFALGFRKIELTPSVAKPLPYGLRDIKLTPYVGLSGFGLNESGFKPVGFVMPGSQVFEFSNEEAYLDDSSIVLRGKRDWNISMTVESVDPQVLSILFGEDQCSQQSRCKVRLLNAVGRAKRFWRKVIRHSSQRVVK